jgi:hypothetical protein
MGAHSQRCLRRASDLLAQFAESGQGCRHRVDDGAQAPAAIIGPDPSTYAAHEIKIRAMV